MINFTEEQKKQLSILHKKYALKTLWLLTKCFLLIVLSDFLVILADVLYVHSQFFVFIASFASGICFSKLFMDNLRFLGDDLKVETLKISEDK